jgi:predicted MFS family arabinose efflux permease
MNASTLPSRLSQAPPTVLLYLSGMFAIGFTIDGGIYSVLQNLYLLRLGYGPEFIGAYNSAGLFIFALLSLPIGTIRRLSSRRLLLIGLLVTFVGMLAIPLALWLPAAWRSAWLLAGRILSLIGLSFFFVHSAPFLMGITSGDWQNRSLAWQSATLSGAGFAGGLLGGYMPGWIAAATGRTLDDPVPYQYPLLLATSLLLLAFFAIWRTPEPVIEAVSPSSEALKNDGSSTGAAWAGPLWLLVLFIALVRILQMASPGAIFTFTNVYFDDALGVATNKIGIATAIGRLASVPMSLIAPRMLARWGSFRLVIWVSLASAAATLFLTVPVRWEVASLGYILVSGVGPFRYLTFLVFSFSLIPPQRRALISGAGEMSIGMGFALMAFTGGFLITRFGYNVLFSVSLGATLLGTVMFWLLFRRYRGSRPVTAQIAAPSLD